MNAASPTRPVPLRTFTYVLLGVVLSALGMLYAQAPPQGIEGRVVNGTTHKPVPKAQVSLVFMQQGPTPVASQATDAEGKFHLDHALPAGPAPALLRVDYQGATYSRPLLPGLPVPAGLEIEVFDAGHDPSMVSEKDHAIFFHPSGNTLMVLEQIVLQNHSQPPKAFVDEGGTYAFTLPAAARDGVRVTVTGPGGMPIGQPTLPKSSANTFAISYPIRPGDTQVRLEYAVDYKAPYTFSKMLDYPLDRVEIVTPGKEVTVSGDSLTPLGSDPSSGFMGYQVKPKGKTVQVQISGEAPQSAGGEGADESASLVPIAGPVSQKRWFIISGAGIILLVGFVYLYRRE